MEHHSRKQQGAFYTPEHVARSLVRWVVQRSSDRLLDPSCGDGRFLVSHKRSVGVEQDPIAAAIVHARSPGSLIHQGDFFSWAAQTGERFECIAGNPPFIRYQRFTGNVRETALKLCARVGARLNGLSSSWAPFIVAASTLLKPNGRMAFVVPAEIGHAPYARPVLQHLTHNFEFVQIVASRQKLFPELSEDCWLLYCAGFGGQAHSLKFTKLEQFRPISAPPRQGERISVSDMSIWNDRLRPFLLSPEVRATYRNFSQAASTVRLGDVARVGIGYVTGANDFFHLRPSDAHQHGIPQANLLPAVRNGRDFSGEAITRDDVRNWMRRDSPNFLLKLDPASLVPREVNSYLNSPAGRTARQAYKCRSRKPWYSVPDVRVPDAFLTYMCSDSPILVENRARCVGTNSVHVVELRKGLDVSTLRGVWSKTLTKLSCEIEGHPLGGGMLKLEPREASNVLLDLSHSVPRATHDLLWDAVEVMRRWRHRSG